MILNQNKLFKTTTALFSIIAVFLFVQNYQIRKEASVTENSYKDEKTILQNQLSEILTKYDSLNENYSYNKEKLEELSKALNLNYQRNFNNEKNLGIHDKIANLKVENETLENRIQDLNRNIELNNKKIEVLKVQNETSDKFTHKTTDTKLTKHNQLIANNVNARGVRVMSDLYKKTKDKKIQELRVCFTLEANEFIGEGNKKIYIQIINPNGQIISPLKSTVESNSGETLKYSAKLDAFYNQKDTDVCAYVDLEKNKTINGTYTVNLFYDFTKIGSTTYDYH